jgi:hypothetical protein
MFKLSVSFAAGTFTSVFLGASLANGQDYQKEDKGIEIHVASAELELALATLVEDGGSTTHDLKGAFRKTTFNWSGATRQLSWTTEGDYCGPYSFRQMSISIIEKISAGNYLTKRQTNLINLIHEKLIRRGLRANSSWYLVPTLLSA